MIPFNRPHLGERELACVAESFRSGKVSGDGAFSRKCQTFLEARYGIPRALLTTSCTDALELAALLLDIGPEDEVILPSFTFVSTANAFALRGARLVFADSLPDHPNVDPSAVEALVTERTRVIVPVHYAGVAVDMDPLLALAKTRGLHIVEDAAQAIESTYRGHPLGAIGHLGTFSFHETKNIHCGEGGFIALNDSSFLKRAEIIREKGTNRSAFFRGEVDKYGWVDIGSSFLPSDILASILWAQLECIDLLHERRKRIWQNYAESLVGIELNGWATLPRIPEYAGHNAHAFYLVMPSADIRQKLIDHLASLGILAVFHYQSLHRSSYFRDRHDGRLLPNADKFSECLLRLPLFPDLSDEDQMLIVDGIYCFFGGKRV